MKTKALQDAKFAMKLYENGEALEISPAHPLPPVDEMPADREQSPWEKCNRERHFKFRNMEFHHSVRLSDKKATTIMAAFKLVSSNPSEVSGIPLLTDETVLNLAGLTQQSSYASNWMWKSLFSSPMLVGRSARPILFYEPQLGLIQRCLERVLSAHHIRLTVNKLDCGVDIWPHVPGSAVSVRQLL